MPHTHYFSSHSQPNNKSVTGFPSLGPILRGEVCIHTIDYRDELLSRFRKGELYTYVKQGFFLCCESRVDRLYIIFPYLISPHIKNTVHFMTDFTIVIHCKFTLELQTFIIKHCMHRCWFLHRRIKFLYWIYIWVYCLYVLTFYKHPLLWSLSLVSFATD